MLLPYGLPVSFILKSKRGYRVTSHRVYPARTGCHITQTHRRRLRELCKAFPSRIPSMMRNRKPEGSDRMVYWPREPVGSSWFSSD